MIKLMGMREGGGSLVLEFSWYDLCPRDLVAAESSDNQGRSMLWNSALVDGRVNDARIFLCLFLSGDEVSLMRMLRRNVAQFDPMTRRTIWTITYWLGPISASHMPLTWRIGISTFNRRDQVTINYVIKLCLLIYLKRQRDHTYIDYELECVIFCFLIW